MYFVMTDVHGCFTEAAELLERFAKIADQNRGPHTLVNLGDNIDRGPNPRACLELFKELNDSPYPFKNKIYIPGNHEAAMLDASEEIESQIVAGNTITFAPGDDTLLGDWCIGNMGGLHTFNSYMKKNGNFDLPGFRRHIEFIQNTFELYHQEGEFLFCHAGIDPRIKTLEDQNPQTFMWVRDVFLDSHEMWDWRIVHGHTPNEYLMPEVLPNRINLDTGCVFSGVLTGLVIEDINDRESIRVINNKEKV